MRVNLFFTKSKNAALDEKAKDIEFIRLRASVKFQTSTGFGDIFDAIVDTGAPISLIPPFIWKKIEFTELADHEVGGMGGSKIPVKVAKLRCRIVDDAGNHTQEMDVHAFLAQSGSTPLILGFQDLLANLTNHFDHRINEAWLEE